MLLKLEPDFTGGLNSSKNWGAILNKGIVFMVKK